MGMIVVYGPGGEDPTKPNGNIVEQYEVPDPPLPPLTQVGALATLLAVTEVVSVQDAANAVGLDPQALIDEAEAWAEFTTDQVP
jgi:hypothetical protein